MSLEAAHTHMLNRVVASGTGSEGKGSDAHRPRPVSRFELAERHLCRRDCTSSHACRLHAALHMQSGARRRSDPALRAWSGVCTVRITLYAVQAAHQLGAILLCAASDK